MTGFQVFRNTLIVLVTLGLAYIFLLTMDVWIVLLVAILISSALRPLIMRLQKFGLSQGLSILVIYGLLGIISIVTLVAVVPPLVNQFANYIQNDDRLANRIIIAQSWVERFLSQSTGSEVNIGIADESIREAVRDLVETVRMNAPSFVNDISDFIGNFILIIVIGIYWITSRERAEAYLIELLPISRHAQAHAILEEIEYGLGAYVRGIVSVSVIVGLLCFVALMVFRVPGAATLSVIYGLATAIPIIGGFIGVVLATGLAVLSSPAAGLTVLVVTVLIQQIENYLLSPRIMSKSVDFDEILVIIFIAAGFTLNGVTGALLAIPVAGTVAILLKHLIIEPRKGTVQPVKTDGGILLANEGIEIPTGAGKPKTKT